MSATQTSLAVASVAFGFTLGFGVLTAWECAKQTMRARRPAKSIYLWLAWGEIFVCFILSLLMYLLLMGHIKPSLPFFIFIVIGWILKINFVIQIIVNRINLIVTDRQWANRLKWSMVAAIQVLVVLALCWIPAQLKLEPWQKINVVIERFVKVAYLVIDAVLNYIFVIRVKRCLVEQGSKKYDKLVQFNIRIIFVSLAMDVLIIGSMQFPNHLVYTQMHPLGFLVKLRIELAMAKLIRKIAAQRNDSITDRYNLSLATHRGEIMTTAASTGKGGVVEHGPENVSRNEIIVSTTVMVDAEQGSHSVAPSNTSRTDDVEPLRESWQRRR